MTAQITAFSVAVGGTTYTGSIGGTLLSDNVERKNDGTMTHTVTYGTPYFITLTVPFGTAVTALVPTFTVDSGSVAVDGAAQTSGTTANNFVGPVVYTVTDGTVVNYYNVRVTVSADGSPAAGVSALSRPGWSGAKYVTGDLGSYATGGIDIGLSGSLIVVSVQVSGGNTGYFNTATSKFMVYSAAGTEVSASSSIKYSVLALSV